MMSYAVGDIPILNFNGENYAEWKICVQTYLQASGLEDTLIEGNTMSVRDKAKVIIFLRRHIHESLKHEFLLVNDPRNLWNNINERYGREGNFLYQKTLKDWNNLKFRDFDNVCDYISTFYRITSQLEVLGTKYSEDIKVEKTLWTMDPEDELLCSTREYTKHSDLISALLRHESRNALMMRGRSRESSPSPESCGPENVGIRCSYGGFSNLSVPSFKKDGKNMVQQSGRFNGGRTTCYNCGKAGHIARVCRTPDHIVALYQDSLRNTQTDDDGCGGTLL